jgi:hypothetical protein
MTAQLSVQPDRAGAKAPWDLSLTPNYADAMAVDTVYADQISEADFYREYVSQNRPCHLVGAVAHWPAFKQWSDIGYLKQATGNEVVAARSEPLWEFGPTRQLDQAAIDKRNASILEQMPLHDFLDRASARSEQLVLHSMPVGHSGPLAGLLRDIGKFQFLPRPGKSRAYVPLRAFCYRNSYTDWHFHPADEALMTQVVGDKEVLLLPPDDQAWDALDPVRQAEGNLYGIDLARFPAAAFLRPYRAVVKAGDALYIPVYWWHAVQSADDKFGITVAATFSSPLHVAGDMRYPFARHLVSDLLRSRMMPLGLAAVAYSYLHRLGALFSGKRRNRPTSA